MHLEHNSAFAVCWFESNYMELNTDKCHLIISGNKHESFWADIGNDRIWESNYVNLLGMNIDRSLKFDFHMLKVCSKAIKKLTLLSRMSKFLTFEKRRVLIKAYFESHFKYCPLVWCFMEDNNEINRLHERALRVIYVDSTSLLTLLRKEMPFSFHDRNIQQLTQEIYKVAKHLAATAISSLFLQCSNNRHTMSQSDFSIPQVNRAFKVFRAFNMELNPNCFEKC